MNHILMLLGQTTPGAAGQGMTGMLFPMIIVFVIFYFLLIRPQQKKAKEHQEFLDKLEKGEDIVTNGGIIGKITGVAQNVLTIEIAPKVKVKVMKSAVSGLAPKGAMEEEKSS